MISEPDYDVDYAHRWFRSYLVGRTQYVRRGAIRTLITRLLCGVPLGSGQGPLLFVLYTIDLVQLIARHGMALHLYVDDTQIIGSYRISNVDTFMSSISDCLGDVARSMRSNRLQLNSSKTEVMWCETIRRQHLYYLHLKFRLTASWSTR